MKRLFTLLCLLSNVAIAQEVITSKSIQRETEQIRLSEMQRHDRWQVFDTDAGEYTVATENFDVHHVRMDLYLDPGVKYINGRVNFDFIARQSINSITLDLYNTLTVDSVLYHGTKITFQQTAQHGLVINFPAAINVNTKDSVAIYYQGQPAESGMGSFYQGAHSGTPVVWTLSEPYGSRDWWPCKNGLSDKTDSIDIVISCPQQYQPSSNGLIITNTVNGATRTTHFRHRYPIASYLVAIAVTNYLISNDTVQVGSNVYKYLSFAYPESASNFFGAEVYSKNAYRLYSTLFGLYPFADEKYGHTQWGWGGGMEHQTNSFQLNTAPFLSAHELGHHWFGDKITCKSWADIWLNEGFATYSSVQFLEYLYPHLLQNHLAGQVNYITSLPDGSVYVYDTTNVSRIFSSRLTYEKGSYVAHMLRWVVGDSAFYRGIRRYLADPALSYGYALTADLQRNMELESGKDLDSFFRKWVYGEGFPNYQANWSVNANGWVTVKLNQTTTHPSVSFFNMPVQLVLRGPSQSMTVVVDHTFSGQQFTFNPGFPIDTVIIDPNLHILSRTKTSAKLNGSTVPNDLKIYPNPSAGDVFLSLDNPTDRKLFLRVFNAIGQLVYSKDLETPGQNELIRIPGNAFASGAYMLQISSEKNIKTVKKIVRANR